MSTPDEIDHTLLIFGKYRGMSPAQISEHDPKYSVWMHDNITNKGTLISEVLYKECVKTPSPHPHSERAAAILVEKYGQRTVKRYAPLERGSIAESRSHFNSYDENDDAPF